MFARFAHSERLHNDFVRCQRDDSSAFVSQTANMANPTRDTWHLREWRKERGLSLDALAERAGTSKGYLSDLERGERPMPPGRTIEKIAEALEISARQLLSERPGEPQRGGTVPLVGYVGAGAAAHFYATADDPNERVEAPEGATASTVAAEIRGTSLGPAFDRWLVYYDDIRSPVTPDLHGQLCVVALPTDQVLVKVLRPSGAPGRYHLISNGGEEPIFDAEVLWAARVTNMKPR